MLQIPLNGNPRKGYVLCADVVEIFCDPGACRPNAYRRYAWQVVLRSLAALRSMTQCSRERDSAHAVMQAPVFCRTNSLLGSEDLQETEDDHEAASIYDVFYRDPRLAQ